MRSEDVDKFVSRRPFEPFRITLTDGTVYDIHHPEMAMVGYSAVIVGLPRPSGSNRIYDHAITISLSHIMQLESLNTLASQDSAS